MASPQPVANIEWADDAFPPNVERRIDAPLETRVVAIPLRREQHLARIKVGRKRAPQQLTERGGEVPLVVI